jgi:hypothetical protein
MSSADLKNELITAQFADKEINEILDNYDLLWWCIKPLEPDEKHTLYRIKLQWRRAGSSSNVQEPPIMRLLKSRAEGPTS